MSYSTIPTNSFTERQSASVAVLVETGPAGPLVDYPGNPTTTPVIARSTVALEASDEGREVAIVFEFGDPLRPLIVGVIQNGHKEAGKAPEIGVALWSGVVRTVRSNDRADVETNGRIITCSLLDTGLGTLCLSEGETVVVTGIPGRLPCIVGAIRDSAANKRLELKADEIVLNAGEELILTTKRSQLILRSNGDIETKGERLTSRARKLQKLMAPTIKLN